MATAETIIEFGYDIVCPYAYIASTRIEALAARSKAYVLWKPVLLGGIYEAIGARQGKHGSASDTLTPPKKIVSVRDLEYTARRNKIAPLRIPPKHPIRSVSALRLIYAFPNDQRAKLTHALFHAYWVEHLNIADRFVLLSIARKAGIAGASDLDDSIFSHEELEIDLRSETAKAVSRGAPGVPIYYLPHIERLYWGGDRQAFVEAECTARSRGVKFEQVPSLNGLLLRCLRVPPVPRQRRQIRLEFWFDFSSPFGYLGWTQLERMKREAGTGLTIVYKPIVVGALFREIGTPMVPIEGRNKARQAYDRQDMFDWVRFWSAIQGQQNPPEPPVAFQWPSVFPIRSVLPLRVALLDERTIKPIYMAAWAHNKPIGEEKTLKEVLSSAGFNANLLLERASSTKDQLKANTDEAVKLGLVGVPTYRVSDKTKDGWVYAGDPIWGQDKIPMVQDRIAGWRSSGNLKEDVSTTHRLDLLRLGVVRRAGL